MKKNKYLSEHDIIYKHLLKLNFNKKETFDFNNDGAILKQKHNKDLVVTNDAIIESVDFFPHDPPESIAHKLVTYNLSDLSSMGAKVYCYTLSLTLPLSISSEWIKKFSNKLLILQKKYNFFLLGGDIGLSKEINISANFFGYVSKASSIKRQNAKKNDSIWVTGNIGDAFLGLMVKKNKINFEKNINNYFTNKYLYPDPCILGSKIIKYVNSAIDISDGFIGDLRKLLPKKLGASLDIKNIPFSNFTQSLIYKKKIRQNLLLNAGDDYQLIFTCPKEMDRKIQVIFKRNQNKVSKIGKIIDLKGIYVDGKKLVDDNKSYEYFF